MNTFNISEFSKLVRRSVKTLQRWDRDGVLVAKRTSTHRRYYTQEQFDAFLGVLPTKKRVLVYARVSTQAQKPDLANQLSRIKIGLFASDSIGFCIFVNSAVVWSAEI